jgi:tetratricopeptide (TPR) repeat protein
VPLPPKIAAAPPPSTNACLVDRLQVNHATAEQMVRICSDALQSHTLTPPQVALARLNRGSARMALGDKIMANVDYAEALKHYDAAIDPLNPDALAYFRRATALDATGETDRALTDYDEAVRLGPKEPLSFLGRGILLTTRKRFYERAISDFSQVLALSPDRLEALMRRGDAYGQMGNFGPALADLDRAVALAPENAEVHVYRGLANSRRGDTPSALADYTAALARDPQNVDALVNRAAIYSTAGDQPSAIRDLDAAIAVKISDPLAFYNRGYAHFASHEYDLALADYSAAIDLDPKMGVAFTNRCLTEAILGRDLTPAGLVGVGAGADAEQRRRPRGPRLYLSQERRARVRDHGIQHGADARAEPGAVAVWSQPRPRQRRLRQGRRGRQGLCTGPRSQCRPPVLDVRAGVICDPISSSSRCWPAPSPLQPSSES